MFAVRLLAMAALLTLPSLTRAQDCCDGPSWMLQRSTYSHAPETGARVAQYQRHDFVQELPDPRLVTSGYRTTRTNLRGLDGSIDTYYEVQNWANGRGGLDAEWERVHDAWKESTITGSYYRGGGYGYGYGPRYGRGYGAPGYGAPGYGAPGYGAPGYGYPGYRHPGYYGSP